MLVFVLFLAKFLHRQSSGALRTQLCLKADLHSIKCKEPRTEPFNIALCTGSQEENLEFILNYFLFSTYQETLNPL